MIQELLWTPELAQHLRPHKLVPSLAGYLRLARLRLSNRISAKWSDDCKALPLTPAHRELYDVIHSAYFKVLGTLPDLIDPQSFNDKMQWLKLFDQSRDIILCADKIHVRDRIRARVGEKYLVDLLQVRDRFDDIDFAALPDAFVIKVNHDSGGVILVRDKDKFDGAKAKRRINSALARAYGWKYGEWAYRYIHRQVLVERFIPAISAPDDYKFYCVNGKAVLMHYIYDRSHGTKEQVIDLDGNDLRTPLYPAFSYGNAFKKPPQWDEMIWVAEQLSAGFKFVRVDLFCAADRIYAGEMTFWPGAGHYKGDGQKIIGRFLSLDRDNVRPFLLRELDRENVRSGRP